MPDLNKLDLAPAFNPHRQNVAAVDAADDTVAAHGVDATDCERCIADVSAPSGVLTSVSVQPMYWSDAQGRFVADADQPAKALTGPGQFTFPTYGRRFWLKVTALTLGTAPSISISVAQAGGLA